MQADVLVRSRGWSPARSATWVELAAATAAEEAAEAAAPLSPAAPLAALFVTHVRTQAIVIPICV